MSRPAHCDEIVQIWCKICPVDYFGIPAICQRMGWRTAKPLYHHRRHYGFPAFRLTAPRTGSRPMLYSNERLILRWEIEMARLQRERIIARQEERYYQRQACHSMRRVL